MSGAQGVRFRLPPEVFDALHLSALAHGGIGYGAWHEEHGQDKPLCAFGHARDLDVGSAQSAAWSALNEAGLDVDANDQPLIAAGVGRWGRIPFERWCALVGVDVVEAPAHGA